MHAIPHKPLKFSSSTEKKKIKHKNPLKVQMKLLGKGWLEKPQHEAMYTVCGCIVQYMKFLILKQHAVLYCTLLKLCILDLAVIKCPTWVVIVSFQHVIQQIASLKDIMYICYKNNRQQIFIYFLLE